MASPFIPPYTGSTVDVSIILAGRTNVPCVYLFKNKIPGHDTLDLPCFSFLIENKKSGKKILYDLGLMKAWKEKQPPAILDQIEKSKAATFDIPNDIADQLTASNVPLNSINAIIWSHHHVDHTGDPSLFPPTTSLIVGPGFKNDKTTFPGWPRNPDAITVDDAFVGREVIELDFSANDLKIGGFPAVDFFEDGSFYVLQTRGHTHDHISGLARTSENKFIFLGGDIAHHAGEFRPTAQLPLPNQIDSDLLGNHAQLKTSYPPTTFENIHPSSQKDNGSDYAITPFYESNPLMSANIDEAEAAIEKLQGFDALAEVFVVIAHDSSLLDVLPFFPLKLTQWDEIDCKIRGRWLFLRDFLKDLQ